MLFSQPPVRVSIRNKSRRPARAADLRQRRQQMLDDRAVADSTQRAVARGRAAILTAHGRVLCFPSAARKDRQTMKVVHRRLRHLVGRIDGIHRRLLKLSTSVEKELDSLGIAWVEIDWLTTNGRQPAERG